MIVVVGVSHKSAPVWLRERLAVPNDQHANCLDYAIATLKAAEGVVLCTCNRSEWVFYYEPAHTLGESQIRAQFINWSSSYFGIEPQQFEPVVYIKRQLDAVKHLMHLACGLDSLVLGEPQILGQIKSAYALAQKASLVGPNLGRVYQQTFITAKQVRSDTAIGQNPVSVAYTAVQLARGVFERFEDKQALLIGAGKTIELVAKHLREQHIGTLAVANRTLDHAIELTEKVGGAPYLLSDIPNIFHQFDLVISSTGSQLPIVGKGLVEQALPMRRFAPVFMVDLAVPRDIEQQVGDLSQVYLYTVDDLAEVVADNVKAREAAANEAADIIDAGVEAYVQALQAQRAVSTIKAVREQAQNVSSSELEKALKRLDKGDDAREVLEQFALQLTNKLIHAPSTNLKKAGAEGREELIHLAQELFALRSQPNLPQTPDSSSPNEEP